MSRLRKRRQKHTERAAAPKKSKWLTAQAVVTIGIALLMVLSVVGFIYGDSTSLKYNGYDFVQTNTGFEVKYLDAILTFNYHPSTLKDLSIPSEAVNLLKQASLVSVSYTPGNDAKEAIDAARYNFDLAFGAIQVPVIPGTTTTGGSLPIISCANATAQLPVIIIQEGTPGAVTAEGNCVRIVGNSVELTEYYERVIYGVLGIID